MGGNQKDDLDKTVARLFWLFTSAVNVNALGHGIGLFGAMWFNSPPVDLSCVVDMLYR